MTELVPPHDMTAESCVLGSMMLDSGAAAEVRAILRAEDFYRPAHQTIYSVLLDMDGRGEPLDVAAVKIELDRTGKLAAVGLDYLLELVNVPTGNAAYYAGIVKTKARLRSLILLADRARNAAFAPGASEGTLTEAHQAMYELMATAESGGAVTAAEAGRQVLDRAERVQEGREEPGLSLGFRALDIASGGGLRPGQLLVIAAATSVGKTSLGVCFAANVARHARTVKVFSAEMAAEEIAQRWLSQIADVPGLKIGTARNLQPAEWERLRAAQEELERWGPAVEITDRPMTVEAMAADVRRFAAKTGRPVELVLIDYLQLVPSTEGNTEREKVNAISRGCKRMAKALRLPVVLLSQLSRAHQSQNRPPELFDLKESSNIEQDADAVLLLHPSEDPPDIYGIRSVLAKIAKMRQGQTTEWDGPSAIRLRWNPRLTHFAEWADEETVPDFGEGH